MFLFFEELQSDLEMATTVFLQMYTLIIFDFAKGKNNTFLVFASCCDIELESGIGTYILILKCTEVLLYE